MLERTEIEPGVLKGNELRRLQTVQEHIFQENQHNLVEIMRTFGMNARYDDASWDTHYIGHQQVESFYQDLLKALPDLYIHVEREFLANETVILEASIEGHHLGSWKGLPATGKRVKFPLMAVFTFDDKNQLAGEKIYYDRATILKQLGVFNEPESFLGRIQTVLLHPLTMMRILWVFVRPFSKGLRRIKAAFIGHWTSDETQRAKS